MNVLIHACPKRIWYVNEYMVPELLRQGADEVEIWNDADGKGNLRSCMESFAARIGDGDTWHLQDDVLVCRDFVERCRALDAFKGVVYGFTCGGFGDDPNQHGTVYAESAWYSFQCVRIPDAYARECAAWVLSGVWRAEALDSNLYCLDELGQGDDSFFREWMLCRHGSEKMYNAKPNLVEHVDWIVGGSILSPWRGFVARAAWWDDEALVDELRASIRKRGQQSETT